MTCADILPKITIGKIKISTPPFSSKETDALDGNADEWFDLDILHNNFIGLADSALEDNFNLLDVYNATQGADPFYNIKIFLSNDLNVYNFWVKNAALVEAISLQDYQGEQTPTPPQVNAYVYGGKKGNDEVTKAAEDLKQCIFKLPNQKTNTPKDSGDEDDSKGPTTPANAPVTWKATPGSPLDKCQKNLKCVAAGDLTGMQSMTIKTYDSWQEAMEKDPVNWAKTHPWSDPATPNSPLAKCQKDLKCVAITAGLGAGVYYSDTPYEAFIADPSGWKKTHPQFSPPMDATSYVSVKTPKTKPPPQSLYERILAAMLDNNMMDLDGPKDHVRTQVASLNVTPQSLVFNPQDGSYFFKNVDKTSITFGDTALRNLYLMLVPNVEYRVDKELIFTVRSFQFAKLIEDYKAYPEATSLFTSDQLVIGLGYGGDPAAQGLIFGDALSEIEKKLKEPELLKSVIKPKSLISPIWTSFTRHDKLRGFFWLDTHEILKDVIVYDWLLDSDLIKKYNILQSVDLYKNYKTGERVKIASLQRIGNLLPQATGTKAGSWPAYTFIDDVEKKDFDYEIEGYCLSPLYKIFQSLLYGKNGIGAIKKRCDQLYYDVHFIKMYQYSPNSAKSSRWIPKINPFTQYWSDEYSTNAVFITHKKEFEKVVKLYSSIVENLMGDEYEADLGFGGKGTIIQNIKNAGGYVAGPESITILRDALQDLALAIADAAKTQGFQYAASPTSTKQGNKKPKGLVKFIKKIPKSYTAPKTNIFYDFMLQQDVGDEENSETNGWAIDPNFLLNDRYPIAVGSFNALYNTGNDVEQSKTAPYITAQSIVVENKRLNVVGETLTETESVLEDALLRAFTEKETPELSATNVQNPALKLLETHATTIVTSDQAFNFKETPSVAPLSTYAADPPRLSLFNQAATKIKEKNRQEKILKEEIATGKFAVAVLVEDADRARVKVNKFLDAMDKNKSTEIDLWNLRHDPNLAPQLKSALETPQMFKTYPLSYMTHLLNLYTIEVLNTFMAANPLEPEWVPLTETSVEDMKGDGTAFLCRISGTESIAALEINDSFAILNKYFVLNDNMSLTPSEDSVTTFVPVTGDYS